MGTPETMAFEEFEVTKAGGASRSFWGELAGRATLRTPPAAVLAVNKEAIGALGAGG